MKRALIFLVLVGCTPAPQPIPEPTPTIHAAHPSWSVDEVQRVEQGDFWTGMSIDQFACSYMYGVANNLTSPPPEGPHRHRAFDSMTKTSRGTAWGYKNYFGRAVGYFDNDGKLIEFTKTVR